MADAVSASGRRRVFTGDKPRRLVVSTNDVAVGDEILVAGNPEGLEAPFSKGIVSGIRPSSGLLQIDAPISPGSSGGPVVNERGELVGLAVSSLVEGQNLNCAVPSRYLTDSALDRSLPIDTVGRLAISASEYGGFHGPVKGFIERESEYLPDKTADKHIEGPALATSAEMFNGDGPLIETDFFDSGGEKGKMLWEYFDEGLMKRRVDVDRHGKRTLLEIPTNLAPVLQTQGTSIGGTAEPATTDGVHRVYKYDNRGHQIEWTLPAQGVKHVVKFDSRGRETETRNSNTASFIR